MSDQLRAEIIGAGFMGRVHARAVRAAAGTVRGATSWTPQNTASAVSRLSTQTCMDSVEALVDVVHVCRPNSLPRALAGRMIEVCKP
jgi:predicted dehydrogenase